MVNSCLEMVNRYTTCSQPTDAMLFMLCRWRGFVSGPKIDNMVVEEELL
jgi:hypothetical protein